MRKSKIPDGGTFVGPALLWKRITAFAIDMVILMVFVLYPFRKILSGIVPSNASFSEAYSLLSSSENSGYLITSYAAASLIMMMYFYLLEKKMGQTIGKKFMNVYVVSEEKEAKRWQFLVRSMFLVPIFPFNLLAIIDPIVMIFNKTNKRLSEILSKTKVVQVYSLSQ